MDQVCGWKLNWVFLRIVEVLNSMNPYPYAVGVDASKGLPKQHAAPTLILEVPVYAFMLTDLGLAGFLLKEVFLVTIIRKPYHSL